MARLRYKYKCGQETTNMNQGNSNHKNKGGFIVHRHQAGGNSLGLSPLPRVESDMMGMRQLFDDLRITKKPEGEYKGPQLMYYIILCLVHALALRHEIGAVQGAVQPKIMEYMITIFPSRLMFERAGRGKGASEQSFRVPLLPLGLTTQQQLQQQQATSPTSS